MNFNFKELLNDNSQKWIPAILKCQCGEEWSNNFSKVKEGSNAYIESECRACMKKREEEEDSKRIQLIKQKKLEEFDLSLPPRYRGKIQDPINRELLKSESSIICGEFGTGKTWEAYSIARKLFETGEIKSFELVTEVRLLNDLKSDFDYMQRKIDKYSNMDLLIIDEAGKNNDSDFNKAQLFDILNHRYDWEKKTILITNVKTKEDLFKILPTAILDRFRECVIEMKGKSLRYS